MSMKEISKQMLVRLTALVMCLLMLGSCALAESSVPTHDPSPAIYVYQKNTNSVVGVIALEEFWIRQYNRVEEQIVSMGSGVVIREGGYILTNNHVVESGYTYQILMPSGEKAAAELVGTDASTDMAVLKVVDEAYASELVPVDFGSTAALNVGSTVVAIGNPGGDTLPNTVTQGVVSALERSNVSASEGSREIAYIQHDAAINSGNSGGGLFNYKGELVGINTLKYAGSAYSGLSFEGLGFAIPVELAMDISSDLIEYGKVRRAAMGITLATYDNGPEEPMRSDAPSGVYITGTAENSPASKADFKQYDYIYSINGIRTRTYAELTTVLDQYDAGDTVELEIVRYAQIQPTTSSSNYGSMFDYYFGSSTSNETILAVSGGYETIKVSITLEYLD